MQLPPNSPNISAIDYYRTILPVQYFHKLFDDVRIIATPNCKHECEVMVYNRVCTGEGFQEIDSRTAEKGWSGDDNFWEMDPWNPATPDYTKELIDKCTGLIKECKAINVSTAPLAAAVRNFTGVDAYVCPNLIDLNVYNGGVIRKERIRILWAGSGCHPKDLDMIVHPLVQIMEEEDVEVYFFGDLPKDFSYWQRVQGTNMASMMPTNRWGNKLWYQQPCNLAQYVPNLYAISADIALCPLVGTNFDVCKSNIKWLECSMTNSACICTDCPAFSCVEDGVTGRKIKNYEWYDAIKELIHNHALRDGIVKNAKSCIREEWSWQKSKKVELWSKFYQALAK